MAGALSVTQSVCPNVRTCMSVQRCPLSKSNTFDQNFMNLVTLFSTMMSSSSLIMVYMAPCFKDLLPLVYEKSSVEMTSAL